MKANYTGYILPGNCLLKHFTGGKIQGGIAVTGRQGRRRKQQLYDVKKKRSYWKLKEDALDCTLKRNEFGRGYGTDVRKMRPTAVRILVKTQHYFHRVNTEVEFHVSYACVVCAF